MHLVIDSDSLATLTSDDIFTLFSALVALGVDSGTVDELGDLFMEVKTEVVFHVVSLLREYGVKWERAVDPNFRCTVVLD